MKKNEAGLVVLSVLAVIAVFMFAFIWQTRPTLSSEIAEAEMRQEESLKNEITVTEPVTYSDDLKEDLLAEAKAYIDSQMEKADERVLSMILDSKDELVDELLSRLSFDDVYNTYRSYIISDVGAYLSRNAVEISEDDVVRIVNAYLAENRDYILSSVYSLDSFKSAVKENITDEMIYSVVAKYIDDNDDMILSNVYSMDSFKNAVKENSALSEEEKAEIAESASASVASSLLSSAVSDDGDSVYDEYTYRVATDVVKAVGLNEHKEYKDLEEYSAEALNTFEAVVLEILDRLEEREVAAASAEEIVSEPVEETTEEPAVEEETAEPAVEETIEEPAVEEETAEPAVEEAAKEEPVAERQPVFTRPDFDYANPSGSNEADVNKAREDIKNREIEKILALIGE